MSNDNMMKGYAAAEKFFAAYGDDQIAHMVLVFLMGVFAEQKGRGFTDPPEIIAFMIASFNKDSFGIGKRCADSLLGPIKATRADIINFRFEQIKKEVSNGSN